MVDPATAQTLAQTETDLANAVLEIQDRQSELDAIRSKYQQLENDYAESAKYIEDQNIQIQELRMGGKVEIRDHTGNLINIHVPGQEPKPVPKRKAGQEVVIPDLSITEDDTPPTNAGFGTRFPDTPSKGDIFLRVDMLPSRLYKWNEKKWIEVDKELTDSYAYDLEYIKHLAGKVDRGEYDSELLTATELEQIERFKNGKF